MTENGADLIIGTLSHVLQSIEWIECDNGTSSIKNLQQLADQIIGDWIID